MCLLYPLKLAQARGEANGGKRNLEIWENYRTAQVVAEAVVEQSDLVLGIATKVTKITAEDRDSVARATPT